MHDITIQKLENGHDYHLAATIPERQILQYVAILKLNILMLQSFFIFHLHTAVSSPLMLIWFFCREQFNVGYCIVLFWFPIDSWWLFFVWGRGTVCSNGNKGNFSSTPQHSRHLEGDQSFGELTDIRPPCYLLLQMQGFWYMFTPGMFGLFYLHSGAHTRLVSV